MATSSGRYGRNLLSAPTFVMMVKHTLREVLTLGGVFTSRPSAFLILAAFAVSWLIFERKTLDWHGVATLVTWAMTLFIQRAEHRDTQALQAKLDELIRATSAASDDLTAIDDKEPEEIEKERLAAQGQAG